MEIERKRLTDGFTTLERGVHEGKNPSLLPPTQVARSINATFRGGYPTCRPPYYKFTLRFTDSEQAAWFREHNVQGRYLYRSPLGRSFPIYSVGGRIFRVDVARPYTTNVLELTPAGDANPSTRPHVWMEQAEQYLIIQDGQSKPLIYDGAVMRRSSLGAPNYEVPVGRAMAYGMGRLIVVRPHGRSYVIGDIVHGGTEVIQFTEDNYLNEGGDVSVPIEGEITSVKIQSQIDRSTGQGDLMVFTPYGAASARIGERRDTWKNIQFQLVAMLGSGPTSHNSVALVNGDLFFRSRDGIRSVAMTRSEFQNSWSKTPLSREVNRTLSFDTDGLLDFADAAVFDNRLLMLCNQAPVTNGCYHRGLVALDFDLISGMGEKLPPAYDGLWAGLNFTSILAGDFASGQRCFVTHRNGDGENELWELLTEGAADNGVNRIVWSLEGPSLLKAGSQPMSLKKLDGGDIGLAGIVGRVNVSVAFRPDHAECWVPWHSFSVCATAPSCSTVCNGGKVRPQHRTKKRFPQPPDDCEVGDNKPARLGYEFQPRITITGKATINALRMHAIEQEEPTTGCAEDEVTESSECGTQIFRGVWHLDLGSGVHLVTVDMTNPGVSFRTTAAGGTRDTLRVTTQTYLTAVSAQLAINGHFFLPYPSDDLNANIVGFGASQGVQTSPFETPTQSYAILENAPALNISSTKQLSILNVGEEANAYNALSGSAQIITNGVVTIPTYGGGGLTEGNGYSNANSWYAEANGRTCIGFSEDGRTLLILVADRTPGITVSYAAEVLLERGAHQAINLDGGASAALAMEDVGYLNNPGNVAVGSNLAIFADPI